MDGVQTVEATAERVTHRELTSKQGKPFVLYQVETDKGQFTTAKAELAEKVHRQHLNKLASYEVKVVQKGEYTNYYLEGVQEIQKPSGAFPEPTKPPPFLPEEAAPESYKEEIVLPGPTEKDLMIYRQVAAKVAAWLHRPGDPAQSFWEDVDDLIAFFSTGQKPDG